MTLVGMENIHQHTFFLFQMLVVIKRGIMWTGSLLFSIDIFFGLLIKKKNVKVKE